MVNCLIKIIAKEEVEITIVLFRKHASVILALVTLVVAIIFINSSLFRKLNK